MTTRRTTILLDADLLDRLDRHVQRQHTTKTSVIAAAVETWLDSHEATPEFPFLGIGRSAQRPPVARRPLDRAQGGGPPTRATASGDPARPVRDPRRGRRRRPQPRRGRRLVRAGRRAAAARSARARRAGPPAAARARDGGDAGGPRLGRRGLDPRSSRRRPRTSPAPRCCSARRPSTGRGSPTRCWSRRPSGCRSGAWRPSTGARSRCSGPVTCGRWTSSPESKRGRRRRPRRDVETDRGSAALDDHRRRPGRRGSPGAWSSGSPCTAGRWRTGTPAGRAATPATPSAFETEPEN